MKKVLAIATFALFTSTFGFATVMIQLGRVKGNKMVDMQLTNEKLVERGTRMVMNELNISHDEAEELLLKYGSVRNAVKQYTEK